MDKKRILILTSTGGSGHFQAAKAKYHEAKKAYPDAYILQKDILVDWVGLLGNMATNQWNSAQIRSNIFLLITFSFFQRLADVLFWPWFFFSTVRTCLTYKINHIIDTQPLATSAIIKAIRWIKWWKKKEILFEKIITDLPTKETKHFFSPIKRLSKKDRPFLKLITTKPLLDPDQTEDAFWENQCHLPLKMVCYQPFPLRATFLEYAQKPPFSLENFSLDFSIPSPIDLSLTKKILSFGKETQAKYSQGKLSLSIPAQDKVAIIMLGAHPNLLSMVAYTKWFITLLQKSKGGNHHLFVFCNNHQTPKINLQKKILQIMQQEKHYPKHLNIIALPSQNDQIIAPLFHRSNATLTRSGGLTSMEILSICKGIIWIHKEPSLTLPTFLFHAKTIHEGMPKWERGNARYLEIKKGAKLVTPDTFEKISAPYFSPSNCCY